MKITIDLEKLSGDTLLQLAYDLGCEIKCPEIPINKYTKILWDINKNNLLIGDEELKDLNAKWLEEQERLNELIKEEYDKYFRDVCEWLINYTSTH